MSIASRTGRESNQESSSGQEASTTPPPVYRTRKGWVPSVRTPPVLKEPWVQDFSERMRTPVSLGKERVRSVPPKEESDSQQSLYSEEIITRMTGEDWVGFNE